jgi:hypothetical protein
MRLPCIADAGKMHHQQRSSSAAAQPALTTLPACPARDARFAKVCGEGRRLQ